MTRLPLLAPLAALLLAVAPAGGADPAATPAPAPATSAATPAAAAPIHFSSPGSSSTLLLYLVLLVALLGGGAWLARHGSTLFQPKLKGPRKLQLSEMRMLGNRQFLVVAEYEDRKMLLGVCPGRIDYLATLGGAEPEFPHLALEKPDE